MPDRKPGLNNRILQHHSILAMKYYLPELSFLYFFFCSIVNFSLSVESSLLISAVAFFRTVKCSLFLLSLFILLSFPTSVLPISDSHFPLIISSLFPVMLRLSERERKFLNTSPPSLFVFCFFTDDLYTPISYTLQYMVF